MTNGEQQETISIQDKFIREVRVTYHGTQVARFSISGPVEVADFVRSVLPDNSREHCVVLYLDASHQVASYSIVTTGTANSAQLHAREVFQRAVVTGAIAVVLAHNHPSGKETPSAHDLKLTRHIQEAGKILGIPLLDHLIITDSTFHSLQEHGHLND